MTKANECTCPSGDGSLRHPCPAHPASVELAGVGAKLTFINGRPAMCGCQVEYSSGGGEYSDVIDVTLCAKHSGSAILDLVATNRIALTPEYEGQWHADFYLDREIPLAKAEGATPAEAVLALMSAERIDPEQESVEQAGGDERAADAKPCATRCPDCGEHDLMPGDLCACGYETDPATGYACSECDGSGEGCVGEVCRECDGSGWLVTPDQARAALAQPSPKCSTCGGTGMVDDGEIDCYSDGTPFENGPVKCVKDCPACKAQPSPAQAEQHWPKLEKPAQVGAICFSAGVSSRLVVEAAQRLYEFESTPEKEAERIERLQAFREQLDPLNLAPHAEAFNEAPAEALKPEPAEADRPEVVAWQYRVTAGPQTGWSLWHPGKGEEFERSYTVERRPLMTVAQYDRIVGELRAVIAQLRQHKNDYMDSGQQTYRALQNEIREREAEIARLDGLVSGRTAERDAALARVAELTATRNRYGLDAHYFNKNLQRILRDFESFTPDELARSLIILAKVADEKVVAQAQHSVPEGWMLVPVEPTQAQLSAGQTAWLADPMRRSTTLYRAMLAAAPQPVTEGE